MPGELDPALVKARTVLLDALEALDLHRGSLVLIGAQAVYQHTGAGDLGVAPFTTDADLAIDPSTLIEDPKLVKALTDAGFVSEENQIGRWTGSGGVQIDLLVPEAVAGGGSRSADLGVHGRRVARRAKGIEATLIDHIVVEIIALDEEDGRRYQLRVAGPAALLVAKMHKLKDRKDTRRISSKDALDVFRLLSLPVEDVAPRLGELLLHDDTGEVTREALEALEEMFGSPAGVGSVLAGEAMELQSDPALTRDSAAILARDLLQAIGSIPDITL